MKHDSDILKRIKSYFMRRKTADESYAFEREAEKDAFLYEAMEGFEGMLTSDIQQAMDELDDRLDEKAKRLVLKAYSGMAAIFIALVAIGIILWLTGFRNSESGPDVAIETQSEDTYSPKKAIGAFDTLGQNSMDADTSSRKVDSLEESTYALGVESARQAVPLPSESIIEIEPRQSELGSYEPVALADDYVESMVQKEGLEIDIPSEEIADGESMASEVATFEEAAQPRTALNLNSKQTARSAESTSAASTTPVDGWNKYNSYLNKNLNASESMPSGKVTLTFELGRNGKPKKIQVVKSLCTACDAEALRLIENGPAWMSDDRKAEGSVNVRFP